MTEEMDWTKLQAKYWKAFSELTSNAATEQARASAPSAAWHDGLEQWARLFGNQPNSQSEVVERMLASAKGYLSTMQSTLGSAFANPASGFNGSANTAAWMESLRNAFAMPGAFNMPGFDAMLSNNPLACSLRDIAGQGAKSFEQIGAQLAPFIEAAKHESSVLMKLPTFGASREKQERLQKLLAAWMEYQEASQRYNAELGKSSQRSFEILQDKLAARSEPGRQIDSMRGFYDLWVDSAEEAYAEVAMAEHFRTIYGDLVNAQMRVRSLVQNEIEQSTRDLGMPTRSEVNSVEKRLHELRREFRHAAEAGTNVMVQELTALRAEVDKLKHMTAEKPTVARVTTKSAVASTAKKPVRSRGKIKSTVATVAKSAAKLGMTKRTNTLTATPRIGRTTIAKAAKAKHTVSTFAKRR